MARGSFLYLSLFKYTKVPQQASDFASLFNYPGSSFGLLKEVEYEQNKS